MDALSRKSNDQLYPESEGGSESNTDEVQFVRCRAYSFSNGAQLEKFVFATRPGRSESCRINAKSDNTLFDLSTIEDLRFAYDQAIKREARLIDELSGKSAEMEEIQEMFQHSFDVGQKLEQENQDLKTQLIAHVEWNKTLQNINQELENRNNMLTKSVRRLDVAECQTRTALQEARRASYRLVEDLNFQKQLRDELQQDCSDRIESSVQDIAGKLRKEVELERFVRLEAEKQRSVTDTRIVEKESALKDAMSKIRKLEVTLKEKEDKYSRLLVELSTEKANLERKYEDLHSSFIIMEEELAKHYDNIDDRVPVNNPSLGTVNVSFRESDALDNEIVLLEKADEPSEFFSPKSIGSFGSNSEGRVQDLSKHGIFQDYLYVTTAAVKLHFPDLIEDVSSEKLIEVVESSPFHLWYDLMTHYMRIVTQRNSIAKKRAQKKMIAVEEVQSEKMSWIYRIFKRTNNITTTKACSTNVSKSKENNLELGMSNRTGIFARKSRRVKMPDNKSQSWEMEEKDNVYEGLDPPSGKRQASSGYSIVI